MTGLRLINELMDPAMREIVLKKHRVLGDGFGVTTTVTVTEILRPAQLPKLRTGLPIPEVKYLDRKVRLMADLREIWSYINPYMLYGQHVGFRGDFEKRLAGHDPKATELFGNMEEGIHGFHEAACGVAVL